MVKSDPFALKVAQIEAEKAARAENSEAGKQKKPQRPPLSEYNFHPASAQVKRMTDVFLDHLFKKFWLSLNLNILVLPFC